MSSLNRNIVAVAQMRSTNDKSHNLKQIEEIIDRAKSKNASVCRTKTILLILIKVLSARYNLLSLYSLYSSPSVAIM